MITFKKLGRYGNLGNSLFQYSTLLGVGHKLNYNVKIPNNPTYYEDSYENYNYSIFDGFDINTGILEAHDIISYNYVYSDHTYNEEIFNIPDGSNIHGYFQCERYFNFCREYILDNLQFKQDNIKRGDMLFKKLDILPEETVSVHIRRGDFLKKTKFHPVQPSEYFKTAISQLKSKNYLFFSDDIKWCKKVYGKNPGVYFSEGNNPFVDMYAMSKCNDNIIVNSSFSWWGAWLNRNNNKRVIAPKNWFGPKGIRKGYNCKDIIPENWIRV